MSTCLNGGRGSCQGGNSNCLLEQQFLALGWVSHWSQSNSSHDDFTDSNGVNNCKRRNLFPLYIYIFWSSVQGKELTLAWWGTTYLPSPQQPNCQMFPPIFYKGGSTL